MAQLAYLASAVLMGFVLVAVAAMVVKWRAWTPGAAVADRSGRKEVAASFNNPQGWTAGFLLATLLLAAGALLFASGTALPAVGLTVVGVVIAALFVVLIGVFLFYGVYAMALNRGLMRSQAVMLGSWAIGLLFILTIIAVLLVG